MRCFFGLMVVLAAAARASAQCPPCAESWQTPDQNCYCAMYECKAGNPRCDVDVEGLAALPCDQIITPSTAPTNDWSAINWNNRVICIEAGDHTGRGTLTITTSGTSGMHKVLRCVTSAGGACEHPATTSDANRAKVFRAYINGADYLILHRLSFRAESRIGIGDYLIEFGTASGSTDNILNELFVEGRTSVPSGGSHIYGAIGGGEISGNGAERLTVQGTVIATNYSAGGGYNCVGFGPQGTDVRLVNSEIYNWCEHNVQHGNNNTPTLSGFILENSDIYYTSAFYGYAEDIVVYKASGTVGNPFRAINNRIWGGRWANSNWCCDGGGGTAISIAGIDQPPYTTVNYTLAQNNIILDSIGGIAGYPGLGGHHSAVGNVVYNVHQFNAPPGDDYGVAFGLGGVGSDSEWYLNTVINGDKSFAQNVINADKRCNVVIDGGSIIYNQASGEQQNYNAYYGSSNMGETNNIVKSLALHTNSTSYASGAVVRTSNNPVTDCTAANDSDCFLYMATTGGTSGEGTPPWCTNLGCTFTDGSVTWRAIRGPYCFYRKLLTAPEQVCIPYAVPDVSAPEYGFCRGIGLGSRPGIGIDDEVAPW